MAFALVVSLSLAASLSGAVVAGDSGTWQATTEDVETTLIAELAGLVRSGGPHRLEAALGPIYDALPKNAHGRLEPEAVRSGLRSLFLQRPGWTLKGLAADGDAEAWVPAHLQKLVADRTNGHGVGLREVAAMAASLEELSRKEATARLQQSYQIVGLALDGRSERSQVLGALRLYAEAYIGSSASAAPASDWLQRLDGEQWLAGAERDGGLSFQDAGRAALAIERQMSRFKSQECSGLQLELAEPRCLDVSSLYSLCCRSGEEPSVWEAAWTEFPGLWLFSFVCLSLSALVTLVRKLCGSADAVVAQSGEAPAAEGNAEPEAVDEIAAAKAEAAAAAQKTRLLVTCLAWCLACGGAVAADLLDMTVIAPALLAGLGMVAAGRLAPAKAKKM